MVKTLKLRVKDKHIKVLNEMAKSVNFVWNYINDLSSRSIRERGVFLSDYDINKYTKGSSKELSTPAQTIQEVSREYVIRRNQSKKRQLRWRKSKGSGRSLGWIPFTNQQIKIKDGKVKFNGVLYSLWDQYGLKDYKLKSGSFNEDSKGRWYFNVAVEVDNVKSSGVELVGIDLGCKDAAVTSTGLKLDSGWYRELESKLKVAQRANKKDRVRSIHLKIKNRRKDAIHKFTSRLVNSSAAIFIGNVSSQKLIKTKMAKSVLDASWGQIKSTLEYKCANAGVIFEVINEAYSTQTCSSCGIIPDSSPKGRLGLRIRQWICSECGAEHDRDINASKNIAAAGHRRLAEGIQK